MKKLRHSKLAVLPEKGGKTRVVAIVDSITQSFFKPLHDHMFTILRRFSFLDGTFDQDKQRHRIQEWTKRDTVLFSFDLSSATDRLPMEFQAYILPRIGIPLEIVAHWYDILSHRAFEYKDSSCTRSIQYSVGTPMGCLSSWSAMAIMHHVVVQLAAVLSGRRKSHSLKIFVNYSLLGDDIVIADQKVAHKYRELMTSVFGVKINMAKSFIGPNIAEFAKSLFYFGKDLSCFP